MRGTRNDGELRMWNLLCQRPHTFLARTIKVFVAADQVRGHADPGQIVDPVEGSKRPPGGGPVGNL